MSTNQGTDSSNSEQWWAAPCPACEGSGEFVFNNRNGDPAYDEAEQCKTCAGTGRLLVCDDECATHCPNRCEYTP